MPETPPLARRVKSEIDSLNTLRKQKPVLFLFICVAGLGFAALWSHEKFWGKAQLASDNATLKQQLILTEAQLGPFKTIALQKYPGRLEEALATLAEDIQRFETRLNRAEQKIRSLDLEIAVEFRGTWVGGKAVEGETLLYFVNDQGASPAHIELRLEDDSPLVVKFGQLTDHKIKNMENGNVRLSFRCVAMPRSPIFGMYTNQFRRWSKIGITLVGTGENKLERKPVQVLSVDLEFFVNSISEWKINIVSAAELMPNKTGPVGFEIVKKPPGELLQSTEIVLEKK